MALYRFQNRDQHKRGARNNTQTPGEPHISLSGIHLPTRTQTTHELRHRPIERSDQESLAAAHYRGLVADWAPC